MPNSGCLLKLKKKAAIWLSYPNEIVHVSEKGRPETLLTQLYHPCKLASLYIYVLSICFILTYK